MPDRQLTPEEIKAAIAKAEAEARKFDAEAKHFELMSEHASELVKQAREQAKQEAYNTRVAKIGMDQTLRQEKHLLATNFNSGQMVFDGDVSYKNVRSTVESLSIWSRENGGEDLDFVITSYGGDMVSGFQLVDFLLELRRKGHKVTTIALGAAMSMGCVILQAGEVRAMGRHAMLLVHEGSLIAGGTAAQVEDQTQFAAKLREKAFALIAERAKDINSKTTLGFLKKNAARRDWYLTAEEALSLGLVDEIR